MIDFAPHRAVWTPEKSARFRSALASLRAGNVDTGISGSVIRFARAHGADVSGPVLELGGQSARLPGAHSADISADLGSEVYSTAFVVDTVEHLLDDELRPLIEAVYRALRSGGTLIVVAPNEEKLKIGETVCPDCGCMFHRLHDVRSWNAVSLAAFLSDCGFETVVAVPWYLDERWWKSRLISLTARSFRKRLPHLIYAGRKRVVR
jgi:SAM-dependent methyltransferase